MNDSRQREIWIIKRGKNSTYSLITLVCRVMVMKNPIVETIKKYNWWQRAWLKLPFLKLIK